MRPNRRVAMKLLHLNLKYEYFDQIHSGEKVEEYRLYNAYWIKRLINPDGTSVEYDGILIKRGYPKRGDTSRILERPWRGWTIKEITHPHFGNQPVKVFAIRVNP
mgnify:CR=1 FL=1